MFVYFSAQEAKVGYNSKMQSNKFKSLPLKKWQATTAKFGRVKKIVKLMLIIIGG
jgi:hypothetical protein